MAPGYFGKGRIAGKFKGKTYVTGQNGTTGLGNTGSGLFARRVTVKRPISDCGRLSPGKDSTPAFGPPRSIEPQAGPNVGGPLIE